MAEAAGTGSSAGFRYWSPADRQPSAAMLKGPLEEGANANGVKQVVLVWGGGGASRAKPQRFSQAGAKP